MTVQTKLAIIGASGHGREILDVGHDLGIREFKFLDLNSSQEVYHDYEILEDGEDRRKSLSEAGWQFAIGIADPKVREKIALQNHRLSFVNLIHPSVTLGYKMTESIKTDTGIIIQAGCRVSNSITLGRHVMLHLNTTIGHDSILEDFVSIMPGVNLSGNVHLSKAVYIGTGASVINGKNDKFLKVGERTIIGAGAVVIRDLPAGVTAVGIPAKPLKV